MKDDWDTKGWSLKAWVHRGCKSPNPYTSLSIYDCIMFFFVFLEDLKIFILNEILSRITCFGKSYSLPSGLQDTIFGNPYFVSIIVVSLTNVHFILCLCSRRPAVSVPFRCII